MLAEVGLARCALRASMGERPVTAYCETHPTRAIMAARPFDLLHAHLRGVDPGGVEGEVEAEAGLALLIEATDAHRLEQAHDGDLDRDEGREVDAVVDGARLPELGKADEVGVGNAGNRHHRPAGVHELSLLEVREGLGVGAEAEGVEAEVAGHGAVEVLGRGGAGVPELTLSLDNEGGSAGGLGSGGARHGAHGVDAEGARGENGSHGHCV